MKVFVRFFAYLEEIVNIKNKVEIELKENSDVRFLLETLCDLYNIRETLFKENNELQDQIAILKNGREIQYLSGMETKLNNGDEISVFPPVAGG
jgi:molybdopterin synthase sulfur carrier subunit